MCLDSAQVSTLVERKPYYKFLFALLVLNMIALGPD